MRAALYVLSGLPLIAGTAVLDGGRIYYEAAGRGAVTVVLIHGWTCDHTFWDAQVAALRPRYRVLALDLPGHGRSDPAPEYSMKRYARAVNAVLDKENADRAVLVGHSMGGAVMLEFARLYPRKVRALVAVDAHFPDPETAKRWASLAARLQEPGALQIRAKMIHAMFTDATTPALRSRILEVMLATPAETAAGAMKGLADPSLWREDRVDLPFLQIAAASTFLTEESLRRRFPRAELVRVPGTGHFLHMERPAEVNRILLDWLGRQGF